MSDWEVVEEALHRNGWRGDYTAYGGKNYALRGEGLAALARLREREAQLRQNAEEDRRVGSEQLAAAEARVEELEAALREIVEEFSAPLPDRYEEDDPVVIIARRALEPRAE